MYANICLAGYDKDTTNYQAALRRHGYKVTLPLSEISVFRLLEDPMVIHMYVNACDLLLLPGGGDVDPSFFRQTNTASRNVDCMLDRLQFFFLEAFQKAGKPVLGICKGMQLINIFFGGTLDQDMPSASHTLHLGSSGDRHHCISPLQTKEDPPQIPYLPAGSILTEHMLVNSAHHQCISTIGADLIAISHSDDDVIETICHSTLPIVGVQWHPERLFVRGEDLLHPVLKELLPSP